MSESEKEKKIFLSYCGSRDQELEEPLDALIKLLDEWEYENDTWIDDDGRLERWLVEFQKHAPTKEKREKLRKMIDLKYKKRGLPYPTEADFD